MTVLHADCLGTMRGMEPNSVDAVVTDPPYGLEFMGKEWDRLDGRARQADLGSGRPQDRPRFGARDAARMGLLIEERRGAQAWHEAWAREAFRVLKPGGHMLAFGGTRTHHRLMVAVEDAGFEIRDTLMWLYGSGFPKSLDVSKAIDKARDDKADILRVTAFVREARNRAGLTNRQVDEAIGAVDMCDHWTRQSPLQAAVPTWGQWLALKALLGLGDEIDAEVWRLNGRKGQPGEAWHEREIIGTRIGAQSESTGRYGAWGKDNGTGRSEFDDTAPATDAARAWQGFGTALKPAWEPIVLARKPLAERNVAANVLRYSTGSLNIDGCRISSGPTAIIPAWERDASLCDSCAEHAVLNGKLPIPETRASTATKPAEPTTNGRVVASQHDTSRLGTGCSDGTKAASTSTSSSTVKSGKTPTDPCLMGTSSTTSTTTRPTTASKTCSSCGAPITTTTTTDSPTSIPMGAARPSTPDAIARGARWPANLLLDPEAAALLDAQSGERKSGGNGIYGGFAAQNQHEQFNDAGGASRFFATFEPDLDGARFHYCAKASRAERNAGMPEGQTNQHPTVKSLLLMRWLCRLICPPGGTILDPFCGSGSTGAAAALEGFDFIGIEQDAESVETSRHRIAYWATPEAERPKPTPRPKPKITLPAALPMFEEPAAAFDVFVWGYLHDDEAAGG